jgi:hypothetical protein
MKQLATYLLAFQLVQLLLSMSVQAFPMKPQHMASSIADPGTLSKAPTATNDGGGEQAFKDLWTDQTMEYDSEDCEIIGTIPSYVNGVLVRNGPGIFESADNKFSHVFDGLAKLSRFRVSGKEQKVQFSMKFLRSNLYDHMITQEKGIPAMAYTGTPKKPFSPLQILLKNQPLDNYVVRIQQIGDSTGPCVALTDAEGFMIFDKDTLASKPKGAFDGKVTSGRGIQSACVCVCGCRDICVCTTVPALSVDINFQNVSLCLGHLERF